MSGADIDIYDNLGDGIDNFRSDVLGVNAIDELYDDVIVKEDFNDKEDREGAKKEPETTDAAVADLQAPEFRGKRVAMYIGNLTWWTTDQDLISNISALGVHDIVEIKFHENRMNGQSKGFCVAVFGSEQSAHTVQEKLVKIELHGQTPAVTPCNKQSLAFFEAQSGVSRRDQDDSSNHHHHHSGGAGAMHQAAPPQFMGQLAPLGNYLMRPGMPPGVPFLPHANMRPPPGRMMAPNSNPPPLPQHMHQHMPNTSGQPLPHINPAFLPPDGSTTRSMFPNNSAAPSLQAAPSMPLDMYGMPLGVAPPGLPIAPAAYPLSDAHQRSISEQEIEEILGRNRTVSSSAISRAVQDAAAGDYASAIETLVTAISLIRQSKIADDDRCKIFISSLQDTLHGIETKSYSCSVKKSGGSASRRRRRSRSDSGSDGGGSKGGGHFEDAAYTSTRKERNHSRSGDRDRRRRSRDRDIYPERGRDREFHRESRRDYYIRHWLDWSGLIQAASLISGFKKKKWFNLAFLFSLCILYILRRISWFFDIHT